MSEQLEMKSLAGLANKKGAGLREAPDARAKADSAKATSRGGFDGFLKTFIGKENANGQSRSAAAQGGTTAANGKGRTNRKNNSGSPSPVSSLDKNGRKPGAGGGKTTQASGHAANLSSEEKRALRRAVEKTVDAGTAPAAGAEDIPDMPATGEALALPYDPAVAVAAEEAARLIWGLMFGDVAANVDTVSRMAGGADAVSRLAELLGAMGKEAGNAPVGTLAGLGLSDAGIDAEAVAQAMETANASAEMNRAAVLSVLEELLDGMPRQALEDALAKTATELAAAPGGDGDAMFNEIARALGLEIVTTEAGAAEASIRLLAELEAGAVVQELEAEQDGEAVDVSGDAGAESGAEETSLSGAEAPPDGEEHLVDVYADADEAVADGVETVAGGNDSEVEGVEAVKAAGSRSAVAVDKSGSEVSEPPVALSGAVATSETDSETVADVAEGKIDVVDAAETPTSILFDVGRQNETEKAAENSGPQKAETEIYGLFKQFLKEFAAEKSGERPINSSDPLADEAAGELLEDFVVWLSEVDKSSELNALVADPIQLALTLEKLVVAWEADPEIAGDEELSALFSWVRKNLESVLQPGTSIKAPKSFEFPGTGVTGGNSLTEKSQDGAMQDPGLGGRENGGQPAYGSAAPTVATNSPSAAAPQSSQGNASAMLDQIQNIERLAEAMRMANRGGVKNLTLQLSPPELGKVTLRVEARDGVVSAYLRVEKPEAAAQLASNLSQLRENLKAQGIELGELDIRQQNHQAAMGDFGGHRHKRNHEADADGEQGFSGTPSLDDTDETGAGAALAKRGNRDANGNLNFFA